MDEGPAEVMLEMSDYLHELVPADLEGMAVQGDLQALIHKAIARDRILARDDGDAHRGRSADRSVFSGYACAA